jgi:hypothetical protein
MATAATKPTAAKTRALTQERAEKTAVLPVRTPNVKWDVSRFGPPGALRNTWCMNAPDSVSYKDIVGASPHVWRSLAERLSLGDEVFVRNDSLTYWAHLIVVASNPSVGYVQLRELAYRDLRPPRVTDTETEEYEIVFRGLTDKHVVIRKADGMVMRTGFRTMTDARYYIQTDLRAAAAFTPVTGG